MSIPWMIGIGIAAVLALYIIVESRISTRKQEKALAEFKATFGAEMDVQTITEWFNSSFGRGEHGQQIRELIENSTLPNAREMMRPVLQRRKAEEERWDQFERLYFSQSAKLAWPEHCARCGADLPPDRATWFNAKGGLTTNTGTRIISTVGSIPVPICPGDACAVDPATGLERLTPRYGVPIGPHARADIFAHKRFVRGAEALNRGVASRHS